MPSIVEGVLHENGFKRSDLADGTVRHERLVSGMMSGKTVRISMVSTPDDYERATLDVIDATRTPDGKEIGRVLQHKEDTYSEVASDCLTILTWIIRNG